MSEPTVQTRIEYTIEKGNLVLRQVERYENNVFIELLAALRARIRDGRLHEREYELASAYYDEHLKLSIEVSKHADTKEQCDRWRALFFVELVGVCIAVAWWLR